MRTKAPIRITVLRSLVVTLITFGAGLSLYLMLGVSVLSAILFAVACGLASVVAAFIE